MTETTVDETTDESDSADEASPSTSNPHGRGCCRRLLVPIVLVVLLLASAGRGDVGLPVAVPPRPADQRSAVADPSQQAASDGTVALLSYSPDTLDKDFANAKTHLTGDFLNYYTQFTHDIVTPAAKQKAVKTSATVVRSAVSDLQPRFGRGAGVPQPDHHQQGESRRLVHREQREGGLTKVGNAWLISSFDPV